MKPYISLIIPAYNEESRLGNTLKLVQSFLNTMPHPYEIIVSDDGSNDKTIDVARSFDDVRVVEAPRNMGKGAAVRRGILAANGDIRVFSDADLSTPIYEIEKILKEINAGADICIGSRAVDNDMIKKHQPFYREFMGKTFNRIVQFFVIKGISDTQCGFKGFREEAALAVFNKAKIDGFSFDVEILYIAGKLGFKVKEVAVEWFNDERTTVSPIKDSFRMFNDILKIKKLHPEL